MCECHPSAARVLGPGGISERRGPGHVDWALMPGRSQAARCGPRGLRSRDGKLKKERNGQAGEQRGTVLAAATEIIIRRRIAAGEQNYHGGWHSIR